MVNYAADLIRDQQKVTWGTGALFRKQKMGGETCVCASEMTHGALDWIPGMAGEYQEQKEWTPVDYWGNSLSLSLSLPLRLRNCLSGRVNI